MTVRKQIGRSNAPPKKAAKQSSGRWELLNAMTDTLGWMPPREHRVLMILFRHADASNASRPGQTRIARSAGCHQTSVSRYLKRLTGWGVLEVVRRGHKGCRKAAVYRITSPDRWPSALPDSCI